MGLLVNEHEKEIVSLPRKMEPERVRGFPLGRGHLHILLCSEVWDLESLVNYCNSDKQERSWSSGLDRGFVYWMLCF